jgi:hypothetical protein
MSAFRRESAGAEARPIDPSPRTEVVARVAGARPGGRAARKQSGAGAPRREDPGHPVGLPALRSRLRANVRRPNGHSPGSLDCG